MEWLKNYLIKNINFKGRAFRKEYWTVFLINTLKSIVLFAIIMILDGKDINIRLPDFPKFIEIPFLIISYIMGGLVIASQMALTVRRLHDTGKSAWWLLFLFLTGFGFIFLLFFLAQKSQPFDNEWGRYISTDE